MFPVWTISPYPPPQVYTFITIIPIPTYRLTREEPFSSPSSKSGAGFSLENKVGALYLSRLLLDHIPKGFTKKLKSVGFFAWAPRGLDDIMLTFDDNTKALVQVKRTLTFSNNNEFREVITN